ncbi:MAG TPA: carbon-nitrogen hydrolase family protein [Alcanivoracaceae bacterium]|nr:carbon-nitrogen hydrolase family protein [Alcanivoracaceae bacterium]
MQSQTIRAGAIQLNAAVGDVAHNLESIERLVDAAAAQGAKIIAIPEFCTSKLPFDVRAHDAVLPLDNPALALFVRLAKRHQCWLGGSMLIADNDEVYNRYFFVEPNGDIHQHDKDLPTMWENCFYAPGNDDGVFDTQLGGVGAAVCWELIRNQTLQRMHQHVQVAITGTHWWTLPTNWGAITHRSLAALGQYNRYMSENAPAEFARRLGVPVIQASHCGTFRTDFMLVPGTNVSVPYDTEYVGATQIVDAQGRVLAQRRTQEGPGVVVADITLDTPTPVQPISDTFWVPELPLLLRGYWHHQNACGKSYYRRLGRERGLAAARRNA